MTFLNNLIRRQESRPHSYFNLLMLATFIGIGRAVQEHLFFGERVTIPVALSMIYFYFSFAMLLTVILTWLTSENPRRVANAVNLGIFVGLFPPLIDLLVSGFSNDVKYSYFMIWNFKEIPYFFYSEIYNVPAGESVTIWLSVIFSGYYCFFKTRSLVKSLVALLAAYLAFLTIFAIIPMLTTRFFVGDIRSLLEMQSARGHVANMSTMLYPFWYLGLSLLSFFALRSGVLKRLAPRMLHTVPFVLVTLWAAQLQNGVVDLEAALGALAVAFVFMAALVQNDYHDKIEDTRRMDFRIEKSDSEFFQILIMGFLFWLLIMGIKAFLPLVVIFMLTILYHHPGYRLKKYWLGSLKVEAAWGGLSFLTGLFLHPKVPIKPELVITMLLVAGGWSVVAAQKDLKDVRGDRAAGISTLYLWLRTRTQSLRKAHLIISWAVFTVFAVFSCLIALQNDFLGFSILMGISFFILFSSLYTGLKFSKKGWFKRQLVLLSLFFLAVLLLEVKLVTF